MTEYITSDWHFGHRNICGENGFVKARHHFSSVEEMNNAIIKSINEVVKNKDTIYHLGDIAMNLSNEEVYSILKKINGKIVLVQGNHDSTRLLKFLVNKKDVLPDGRPKFEYHDLGLRKKSGGKVFYLSHYPIGLGDYRRNMRNICGHIHDEVAEGHNVLNVGIDSPELPKIPFGTPIELITAFELVNKKWEEKLPERNV